VWFLAVIGQEHTQYLLTIAIVATYVWSIKNNQINGLWLLGFIVLGLGVDTVNLLLGLFEFNSGWLPSWLVLLWCIFVWYAYQMRSVLMRFPFLLVCSVGAIGAAASYFAGLKLGAVQWPIHTGLTFAVVTFEWGVLFSFMIVTLKRQQAKLG
jgi:hypothetical protein